MASFPDSLPPESLDIFYKLLLYFTVLYVISTAVTSMLITRKRVKNAPIQTREANIQQSESMAGSDNIDTFDNQRDNTANMMIRMVALESSLQELSDLKDKNEISEEAYSKLNLKLSNELDEITSEIGPRLQQPEEKVIVTPMAQPQVIEAIPTNDQLLEDLGLDDDDDGFLKSSDDMHLEPAQEHPVAKPTAPKSFTAPKPTAPKSFTAPKPTAPKSFTAPKPTAPSAFTPVKPVSPSVAPVSPKPVSPQQPKTSKSGEKGFAKSTSIAAIRMDMLRELARLKKLINEDE